MSGGGRAVRTGGGRWRRLVIGTAALAALGTGGNAAAQAGACDAPPDGIRVVGAVETPVTLARADLLAMETVTVAVTGHDETERTYTGPTLRAILDRADVPGGAELHGRHLSAFVVVEARDGYRVTFALAELDGGYWDTLPILAIRRDGAPLDDEVGPFQVIAPDTPKHGRWARQVACLRVGYPEGW